MSAVAQVRRYAGLVGTAVGVVAAGAAAGVLAERRLVARRRAAAVQPFGSLRGEPRVVVADDKLELYVEVDEPQEETAAAAEAGTPVTTIVFAHGYALNLDCWHFQRAALRGEHRLVFYDHRSHGRSGRSRPEHCTIDQLGRDLAAVIEAEGGDGPVVLVGHSMGGMTIMALAERYPEWFESRVSGVALLCTSAGDLQASSFGLPGLPGRLAHRLSPAVMATLARAPRLVERGRRAGSDLGFVVTGRLAFGGPVPQEYIDFTDEMLSATPFEVVVDFYPGFDTHDKYAALGALARTPTLVIGATEDHITSFDHTRRLAQLLPSAQLLTLEGGGHMAMLERRDEVTAALLRLVDKAARRE